jgi:cohesin complex subunit SA-1/2
MSDRKTLESSSSDEPGSSSSSPSQPPFSSTPARPTQPRDQGRETGTSELGMIVRRGTASLQQTAADWLELYLTDKPRALLQLVQFVFSSAGCEGSVTPEMLAELETQELVVQMASLEQFSEPGQVSLMTATNQESRKFRANYCELLRQIVLISKNSILYDGVLMDQLVGLLISMSSSSLRVFRQTGSLAGLQVISALAAVSRAGAEQKRSTGRQLEAEQSKRPEHRAADRLEVLRDRIEELEQNQTELGNILTYLFKSVFVLRYRDTVPDIRALCIQELGLWLKDDPQRFLDDSYLKYVGWSLHDSDSQVRLRSLQALLPIYESPDYRDNLELFTVKFKDRMVMMILDLDIEVSEEAIKLLRSLTRHQSEALSNTDYEQVYRLVYSAHRKVGQAAGAFLQERLEARGQYSSIEPTRSGRGKWRLRPSSFLIRDIVTFSIEVELENHEQFLADSLAYCCPALTDWEAMTDLLLEEVGPGEEMLALEDPEARVLVTLLVVCVRQAVEGQPPTGRGGHKKVLTAREQSRMREAKDEMTLCMMPNLPKLLHKFLPDPETAAKLLELVQWLDLEQYTKTRQEEALDRLLGLCREAVHLHSHPKLMASLSRALELLCTPTLSVYSRCDTARSHVLDLVALQYRNSMEQFSSLVGGEDTERQAEVEDLKVSLEKLSAMFTCHNLSPYGFWAPLMDTIHHCLEMESSQYRNVEDQEELARLSLVCCYYSLLWDLRSRKERRVGELQEQLDQFLAVCEKAVVADGILAREAFISICDLLLLLGHCTPPPATGRQQDVSLKVTRGMVEKLGSFVEDMVLDEGQDDDFKTVEVKRKMLASFCKLVTFNVVPIKCFSVVLKHLVSHQDRFGDVIKRFLGELRDSSRPLCGRLMVKTLCEELAELQVVDRAGHQFADLQELSKRFALSLGVDPVRNRETLVKLHKVGIEEATAGDGKIELLELLAEFTGRLLPEDKKVTQSSSQELLLVNFRITDTRRLPEDQGDLQDLQQGGLGHHTELQERTGWPGQRRQEEGRRVI